jgi:hypothetical protein
MLRANVEREPRSVKRLLVLVLLVACNSRDSAPQAKTAPQEPSAVVVVNPGADPKHVVRYTLAKGAKVTTELAMEGSLKSGQQGGTMPSLIFDLDMQVEDVVISGDYKIRWTITAVHARDREGAKITASAVESKLDALAGVSVIATLRPDGKLDDSRIDLHGKAIPDGLAQQLTSLAQSMQQIAMPLPTVPVGVGAVWKTMRAVDQSGIKVMTGSTVTVKALDDHTMTLDIASEMHGADQKLQQGTTAVDVSHIAGSGTGHAVVDVSKLSMNSDFSSVFQADMKAQGQATTIDMELKITITSQ